MTLLIYSQLISLFGGLFLSLLSILSFSNYEALRLKQGTSKKTGELTLISSLICWFCFVVLVIYDICIRKRRIHSKEIQDKSKKLSFYSDNDENDVELGKSAERSDELFIR